MPDRYWIACGLSGSFIVAAFFLSGFHWEIQARIRRWRHGGYIR